MLLDILNKLRPSKGWSLSVLILISQFVFLSLIGVAMLVVTYYSSRLVVESERDQLGRQTGIISDLIFEKELDFIAEFNDLFAKEISVLNRTGRARADDLLQGAFYSQERGTIDFLAMLDVDGQLIYEVSAEILDYPQIRRQITTSDQRRSEWNWAVETSPQGVTSNILVYYQSQIIDGISGRLEGYLVSGLFLKDNNDLAEKVKDRIGALATSLVFKDEVLVSVGALSKRQVLEYLKTERLPQSLEGSVFQSEVFKNNLSGAGIQAISVMPRTIVRSLDELFFASSGIGIALILGLSILAIILTKRRIIVPLEKLREYTRKVERRELNPSIPASNINEFNEVSKSMASVLKAFQESERRFEDIISVTSDSIWETDKDHRVSFIYRQPEMQIMDDLEGRVMGKRRDEFVAQEIQGMSWEEYYDILDHQRPFRNIIFKWTHPKNKIVYFSSSGKPRFDNKGEFLGYRGTSTEITAEIRAQQEVESAQAKLRQSQKLEVVGQLTGGIAHDFNNLLSVVIGNLELVLEKNILSGDAEKMVKDAMRGAEKGAALTHQLLAYSRQQALAPKLIRPRRIIEEVRGLLQRALGEGVDLTLQLEDSWSIMVDPNELESALMNLVVNARDAMEGRGKLSIESFNIELDEEYAASKVELEPGEYVCIVVNDSGSGISSEVIDRIFEPFFTTKEVGKGSGLGLSMVFGFAKQSGGHINIYSEVGEGTSMKLLLPRVVTDKEAEPADEDLQTVRIGEGENALVVEDNSDLRTLIVSQLKGIGYKTYSCENAEQAFEIIDAQKIDVVLSDLILPGSISGIDIINKVRQINPEIITLLMTGFAGNRFDQGQQIPENCEVLSKPFTKAKLSVAIYQAKNRH